MQIRKMNTRLVMRINNNQLKMEIQENHLVELQDLLLRIQMMMMLLNQLLQTLKLLKSSCQMLLFQHL